MAIRERAARTEGNERSAAEGNKAPGGHPEGKLDAPPGEGWSQERCGLYPVEPEYVQEIVNERRSFAGPDILLHAWLGSPGRVLARSRGPASFLLVALASRGYRPCRKGDS